MLSIIYITCNRCEELKRSILSCKNAVTIEHEFIIVDNNSTDNTETMIKELSNVGFNIRYLRQNENRGVSGGRNIGYKSAKGELLYFIDDDAYIASSNYPLDKGYHFMFDNPKILAMGTDCYDTYRKNRLCHELSKEYKGKDEGRIMTFVGCSHFIRKGFNGKNYLYPDNLFYGSEELYVGLNVHKVDGIIWHFNELLIIHKPSSQTRKPKYENKMNSYVNTNIIKNYYLTGVYKSISNVMFFFRILRFSKGNSKNIQACYKLRKKRFKEEYINPLNKEKIKKLIQQYGIRVVL